MRVVRALLTCLGCGVPLRWGESTSADTLDKRWLGSETFVLPCFVSTKHRQAEVHADGSASSSSSSSSVGSSGASVSWRKALDADELASSAATEDAAVAPEKPFK